METNPKATEGGVKLCVSDSERHLKGSLRRWLIRAQYFQGEDEKQAGLRPGPQLAASCRLVTFPKLNSAQAEMVFIRRSKRASANQREKDATAVLYTVLHIAEAADT